MNSLRLNWTMKMISSSRPQKAKQLASQIARAYEKCCVIMLARALFTLLKDPRFEIKCIAYRSLIGQYEKLSPERKRELEKFHQTTCGGNVRRKVTEEGFSIPLNCTPV